MIAFLMFICLEAFASAIKAGDVTAYLNSTTTVSLSSAYQNTLKRSQIYSTTFWSTTSSNISITSQSAYSCTIKGNNTGTAQLNYRCSYFLDGYSETMEFYYTVTVKSGISGPTNITISPTSKSLNKGGSFTVKATQIGAIGGTYFTIVPEGVVSVSNESQSGYNTTATVTAIGGGTAYIYAKNVNGISSQACVVTVSVPKEYQSLSLTSLPTMTYGDNARLLPSTTDEGLTLNWSSNNGDVASISGRTLNINGAGTATITASNSGDDEYYSFSKSYTLTVAKAPLTITANDCTREEGEENPELTVSYSGFVNGDDAALLTTQPTATTTATIDSPAGTYPITVSGAEADNYEFTYVGGTLTVTEKPFVLEPTDISQLSDALYINAFEGRIGNDVDIEVRLKNVESATSYGFELVLPEGMSIPVESDGSFDEQVTLSTRHKGHNATTNKLSETTYKIGVISMSSKSLTDNDGVVVTIKAHIDDNMSVGEYAVWIHNPLLVYSDGTKPSIQPTMTVVTIEDYIKGDVDGDGVVDLADAVVVINHYVDKPVNNFIEKVADVDGDGVVDLADAVRIINYYVGKVETLSPRHVYNGLEPQ